MKRVQGGGRCGGTEAAQSKWAREEGRDNRGEERRDGRAGGWRNMKRGPTPRWFWQNMVHVHGGHGARVKSARRPDRPDQACDLLRAVGRRRRRWFAGAWGRMGAMGVGVFCIRRGRRALTGPAPAYSTNSDDLPPGTIVFSFPFELGGSLELELSCHEGSVSVNIKTACWCFGERCATRHRRGFCCALQWLFLSRNVDAYCDLRKHQTDLLGVCRYSVRSAKNRKHNHNNNKTTDMMIPKLSHCQAPRDGTPQDLPTTY